VYKVLVGKSDVKRTLIRRGHGWDGRIILKWILGKLGGRLRTGFTWLRTVTGGGFL
jgi:hypothetical protein